MKSEYHYADGSIDEMQPIEDYIDCQPEVIKAFEQVPFVDTCIEHGPGGTLRLSFQIRVF